MHFSMNTVQILIAVAATACLAAPEPGSRIGAKCMDTSRHKGAPTSEKLYKTCSVYEGNSCCTNETAYAIHGSGLYKFQNVVCKNKELSSDCKKYFLKDACFYECSPDLMPYVNEEGVLKNIPLCQSNCEGWFAACQTDFTCTKDWKKAMESEFTCSDKDKCQTIKDKYQNAKDFCEKVWGSSYVVVADEEKCLRFDKPEIHVPANDEQSNSDNQGEDSTVCGKNEPSSSSPMRYNIVIRGLPFVLCYVFFKSALLFV